MYRLYSRLLQETVQLTTVFAVVHRGQLLVSSSMFSPLTCRGVGSLMVDCWLRGRGGCSPLPFYRLLFLNRTPRPAVTLWMDHSHFWIWPGQHNLAIFLLLKKSSYLLVWVLPGREQMPTLGEVRGWGDAISKRCAERLPSPFCNISPSFGISCSPNGTSAHIVHIKYKKQQQRHISLPISQFHLFRASLLII